MKYEDARRLEKQVCAFEIPTCDLSLWLICGCEETAAYVGVYMSQKGKP